ncbi:MAG: hypothetical protein ACM3QS_14500 [Bacteroidota bacterium]
MNITCWNCKKTYSIDNDAVNAALADMDASKLNFHDVPCPNCGKMNRMKREEFEAAKQPAAQPAEPKMRAVDAKKAREKERAALEKKKGYKGK